LINSVEAFDIADQIKQRDSLCVEIEDATTTEKLTTRKGFQRVQTLGLLRMTYARYVIIIYISQNFRETLLLGNYETNMPS